MDSRRDFMKLASVTLPGGVAAAFLATGSKSAAAELEGVAELLGRLPGNIIYTQTRPGVWKGKEASHIPTVTHGEAGGEMLTKHGMSEEHFIVRHTIVTLSGEVLLSNTFKPTDEEAASAIAAGTLKPGTTYLALSFCNKHDLWLAEVKL